MKFSLCPRCELNYITEAEKYCRVCLQEMHSTDKKDEVELCSICNENPVLPGRDVCSICFREMNGDTSDHEDNDDGSVSTSALGGMDSVAEMDEIIPDIEEDEMTSSEYEQIQASEGKDFGDIENPISLEEEREREEDEDFDGEDAQ